MAGDGTSYEIDLPVTGTSGVNAAATALDTLASRLVTAASASTQAADAVKAGEAAYRQAEAAADRAAKSLERIGLAAAAQEGKVAAALAVGDLASATRAQAKLEALIARQAEAAAKSGAASTAVLAEAAALDKLKAAAGQAADAEKNISKAHEAAKKAADATAKATAVSAGSGKVNEMAEAFGKLGGPLGSLGQKAFGTADGVKKLMSSMGDVGVYAAAAIGVAAVVAAFVALSAAAVVATGKITLWAVRLADKNKAIDGQMTRLKSSIDKLFGGLKIDGLITGLTRIVDLFDETSVTGRAIKVVFESLFQPIVDGLTGLVPVIVSTFIQFEIWALKAMIAIKPYGSTILTVAKVLGGLALVIVGVVIVAIGLFAAAVVAVGVVLALLRAGCDWLVQSMISAGKSAAEFGASLLSGAGSALDWLQGKFNEVVDYLSGLSLAEIGTQIIQGLANGITNAGPAVMSSITGVVGGAIDGAKKLLGIASPSKVFAEIGGYTAEGMAGGVEAGTGQVQSSLESMVAPPEPQSGGGSSSPALQSAGTAGAVASAGLPPIQITVNAEGGDGQSIAEAVRAAVLDVLERVRAHSGVAVPA